MRIVAHHPPVHPAPTRQDAADRAPVPLTRASAKAGVSLPLRAREAWQALNETMGVGDGRYLDNPHGEPAAAWSFGQTAEAALDLASINGNYHRVDQIFSALRSYRLDGGYAPTPHPKPGTPRFFDDNAWIGLAQAQAFAQTKKGSDLHAAEATFQFIAHATHGGKVPWKEDASPVTYNTCANGPAEELALRLYSATGKKTYLRFAEKVDRFMDTHLRQRDGLYIDHVGDGSSSDSKIYSYNQGTPIGAKLALYQATHDPKYLKQAEQTAKASLGYFTAGQLWKQPPAFNAILFRNLMKLDSVAPNPAYARALNNYLSEAWSKARDRNGLFTRAGIGQYAGSKLLDQAGMVQLFALQHMTAAELDRVG